MRRAKLVTTLPLALVIALPGLAAAEPRHGLSIFGDLKYGADFRHFDYVNPDAPRTGKISTLGTSGATTFDSFNSFILKGDAAHGLDALFDSLMTRAADEPDALYGLVAKTADVAPDGLSVTFKLHPEAKFSDGTPLTAQDVANSFTLLKEKGAPQYGLALRDVTSVEAPDAETVKYTFKGALTRDLPQTVAGLPIFSKVFYATTPFEETTLKPPLGSGPYVIKDFAPGGYIAYKRREDYWGKDLPVNRGRYNFEEVRYDYFRDRTVELENLKSGNIDFREEFTSVNWATAYDIPAVKDGRLQKEVLPDANPSGAQGFFINTRREKFKDIRVRQALDLAFDFEWSNKKLFYGLYTRTGSFFENSDMKASGPPSKEELALLEPFRDKLSPEVFGEPYSPPVTDGNGDNRDGLKKAKDLLQAAGWQIRAETVEDPNCGMFCKLLRSVGLGSKASRIIARNAKGETLDIEFLEFDEVFDRVVQPYVANLKRIGVNATIRRVDPAQYQRRVKAFDFDVTTQRYTLRLTPGVELRGYWTTESAKMDGSTNLAGIADPVVDTLIDKVIGAKSRAELVTATRAVDRVLRAGHYWVPHWYKASHNVAYWNKFSRPATPPKYDPGILDTWWVDSEKAAVLAKTKPEKPATPGKGP
jgi:microcin C transport system substrate-binding protein